jgi:hypothetical protein
MNTLEVDDNLVEEAFDKGYINQWECNFVLNLVNFATLSDKQTAKLKLIVKKIARGFQREQLAHEPVASQEPKRCPTCRQIIHT